MWAVCLCWSLSCPSAKRWKGAFCETDFMFLFTKWNCRHWPDRQRPAEHGCYAPAAGMLTWTCLAGRSASILEVFCFSAVKMRSLSVLFVRLTNVSTLRWQRSTKAPMDQSTLTATRCCQAEAREGSGPLGPQPPQDIQRGLDVLSRWRNNKMLVLLLHEENQAVQNWSAEQCGFTSHPYTPGPRRPGSRSVFFCIYLFDALLASLLLFFWTFSSCCLVADGFWLVPPVLSSPWVCQRRWSWLGHVLLLSLGHSRDTQLNGGDTSQLIASIWMKPCDSSLVRKGTHKVNCPAPEC